MIKVHLKGRMGNQMFQFAYAFVLSCKTNQKIIVKPVSHFGYCLELFDLPILGSHLPSSLFLLVNRFLFIMSNEKQKIEANKCMIKYDVPEEFSGNILLDGYFQNAEVFKVYRSVLIDFFKPKEKYHKFFEGRYGDLFKERVLVINYRLREYNSFVFPEINSSAYLGVDWYDKVFERISFKSFGNVIVISDDIQEAKLLISEKVKDPIFIDDKWFVDFQFLLNGNCLVIPNSSFSWWGAFLNNRNDKIVYAPKNWVGYNAGIEYPNGIMTDEFIWI